jgi:serine/threonine protein kinase
MPRGNAVAGSDGAPLGPVTPPGDPPASALSWRFTILSHHAEGGVGRVPVARDEQLHRNVALKEIRPGQADDALVRQRFLAEAEITGQLEHPGIVPIYALGHDAEGRPHYAMRFIQGHTLKEAIQVHHQKPTPLGLRELLQRFITVCQTMAYAHSKGVIHRDLKPSNVMLGDYGETLVVDWGLAKRVRRADGRRPNEANDPAGIRNPPPGLPTVDVIQENEGDVTRSLRDAAAAVGRIAPTRQQRERINHRGTEDTQRTPEMAFVKDLKIGGSSEQMLPDSLSFLCVLCASVVHFSCFPFV